MDLTIEEQLLEEIINIRDLQIIQINNAIEVLKISIILIFFIIAVIIGFNIIKVGFK